MRKATVLAIVYMTCLTAARPAAAILQFNKVFVAKYATDNENEEFVKAVKKARCWVCHQGKKRTNHNPYGVHLVEMLDKKEDKDNEEKIVEALDKVAKMHVDPKDDKSPTYGDLIAKGTLPGGTLEEAKKEPKEEERKAAEEATQQ
jgi:hypothetical protein